MDIQRSFGAIPSPIDERDYQITDLIPCSGRLPDTYINPLVNEIEILDQGMSNECVACSLSYLRWLTEYSQSNNKKPYSPTYIYANREYGMYLGEGMVVREALSILRANGTCFYDDLPGFYTYADARKAYTKVKSSVDVKAKPFRVSSYYAVNGVEQIKNAVYKLGGVSANYAVYDCLYYPDKNGRVNYPSGNPYVYGYHEMTIVGWTEDCWIVLNSWGKYWGKNGLCYIPFEYPITEAWAIVDNVTEVYYKMARFLDTEGHWAEEAIDKAADKGVVAGFEDGTFHPDESVTRAQLCSILNRLGLLDR